MKRTLMLLALAAVCLLPTSVNQLHAQGQVEIRNFVATLHPIRKIVRVNWWASEDSTVASFGLNHSTDGVNYTPLVDLPAILAGNDGNIYEYWHVGAPLGLNFYRLEVVYVTGERVVVADVKVDIGAPIYSYPTLPSNPRPGATPLDGDPDNPWEEARITDFYGRPILSVKGQNSVDLPDLPSGIYILHAKYATGWQASTFVVTQAD